MKLDKFETADLAHQFGGQWCDCIQKVIGPITPTLLASYCIEKEYRQQHAPLRDEAGVRYGYFLKNKVETRTIQGEQIEKEYKLMAGFGEYTGRPFETLQSCLKAITNIAEFERRPPQAVAEDVLNADISLAPPVPEEETEQRGTSAMNQGARRHVQTTPNYPMG